MNNQSKHCALILIVFFLFNNLLSQDYWINTENLPIPPAASRLGLDQQGGLYLSTDGGHTYFSDSRGQDWQHIRGGLTVSVFLPDCTGYVYFGTNDGIYRSRGAATEWEEKSTGLLSYRRINDLIMDSRDNIYVAVSGDGIYRSVDNGENWNFISYSIPLDYKYSIKTLVTNSQDTLFAGTNQKGVFKSIDYGDNWFYSGMNGLRIQCALGLDNDFILLGSSGRGIYRSEDNGNYWAWSNSGLPHTFDSYRWIKRLYQASDGVVYLTMTGKGIFKSIDYGVSWQLVSNDPTVLDVPDLLVDDDNNIIVCGSKGVHYSNDEGNSWNSLNNGLYSENIWIEDVFTGLGNKVFTYTRTGIYISEEKGNNWAKFTHPAKEIVHTYASTDGTIYLIGSSYFGSEGYRTNDGLNWTPLNSHGFGYATDITENKMGVLYLCTQLEGPIMEMYFGGIYSSPDSGRSWSQIGPDDHSYYAIAVNSDNKIFVGPASGNKGLITSPDNGENWTTIGGDIINSPARDILIDSDDHIFVGTDGGVFYSNSDGTSWEKISQGLETIDVKSIVQNSQDDIFVCTSREVYQYNREYKNWEKISSGLSGAELRTLTVSEDDYLYLAYRKNTIARSVHPTVTDIGNPKEGLIATDFYLGTNYPNPFNPSTTISFQINQQENISLDIYDIRGQHICTLLKTNRRPGRYETQWDGRDDAGKPVASGIYIFRLTAGDQSQTRRMLLLR
jgi:photosystem II stability/assembly factor-like uncharacterized protein